MRILVLCNDYATSRRLQDMARAAGLVPVPARRVAEARRELEGMVGQQAALVACPTLLHELDGYYFARDTHGGGAVRTVVCATPREVPQNNLVPLLDPAAGTDCLLALLRLPAGK